MTWNSPAENQESRNPDTLPKPAIPNPDLDYVWSHFFGIFATAAIALVVYVAVMRRNAQGLKFRASGILVTLYLSISQSLNVKVP